MQIGLIGLGRIDSGTASTPLRGGLGSEAQNHAPGVRVQQADATNGGWRDPLSA